MGNRGTGAAEGSTSADEATGRPFGQGRQGPVHHRCRHTHAFASESPGRGHDAAPTGFGSGPWGGLPAPYAGSAVSPSPQGVGPQYVLPARDLPTGPRPSVTRRHHVDPSAINKAIKVAVRRAGPTKHISDYTFRRPFATHSNAAPTPAPFSTGSGTRILPRA